MIEVPAANDLVMPILEIVPLQLLSYHIAVRRDDLDAMRAEIDRLGVPVAFEGEVPGLVFIYLDARESLGHCLEYVWASPEGGEMIGWPKGRPVI